MDLERKLHFRSFVKKQLLSTLTLLICVLTAGAQTPVGTWVTIDDERQVDIAHVKIYKQNEMLCGKVVKLLPEARVRTCEGCDGEDKGRPVEGMVVIWSLERKGDYWSHGKILDPKSGRVYNCALWLDTPDILKVRASFGISLLGRTQTWRRLD